MQIVIEIPNKDIPKRQEVIDIRLHFIDGHIVDADGYGFMEFPKGHGRLIDADKLKQAFIKWSIAVQGFFTDSDIASIVYNSPTIIEADTESEGKE